MTAALQEATTGPVGSRLLAVPDIDWRAPHSHRLGPCDQLSARDIVARMPILPSRAKYGKSGVVRRAGERILGWLGGFPGDGWQARWLAADVHNYDFLDQLALTDPRGYDPQRLHDQLRAGLHSLLVLRVALPSYEFLVHRAWALSNHIQQTFCPEQFADARAQAARLGMSAAAASSTLTLLARMLLHTGKTLAELDTEDFFEVRAWGVATRGRQPNELHGAWDICRQSGFLKTSQTLWAALKAGQRPTAELVDRYQLRCRPIRDLLVRYLQHRRPAMDYSSFVVLAGRLAGLFWSDIEKHHPGIDSLLLPPEVAQAWKERLAFTRDPRLTPRRRKSRMEVLIRVRTFYLDIAQWALEDPSWAPWAVPCPVRKSDTEGWQKQKRQVQAAMHQRVRERLPRLPLLVNAAERDLKRQQQLLALAEATPDGGTFEHDNLTYRRVFTKVERRGYGSAASAEPSVNVENLDTGQRIRISRQEDNAFWAWAILETLRLTGVRVEEMLELTHLALTSYQLPDTGELVPLLQIVPSKTDRERLLLVSPELASVLAAIIKRVRGDDGKIPLVARYDAHERVAGAPLPHLFQRRYGWRRNVIGTGNVQKLLNRVLAVAGLSDAAGDPLTYTPHDFRRLFATDAVTGGLPVHIAAKILGHDSLETAQAYLAVFPDEIVRSYRAFLTRRRQLRPQAEYREPTEAEWVEFHSHFRLRKLALGTCGRPYATPCIHEHACVRCPMLRVDPAQRPRLVEIIANLRDRIEEAEANGWHGEIQALIVSLDSAGAKLATLDKRTREAAGPVSLGLPVIREIEHGG